MLNPEQRPSSTRMTPFLCQELLYEFMNDQLTPQRQIEMKHHLQDCRESQRELDKLIRGLEYCGTLHSIKVTPSLSQALLNFEPPWKKRLQAWTLWSSRRGWRVLPVAFIVVTFAFTVYVTKPWRPVASQMDLVAGQVLTPPSTVDLPESSEPAPVTTPVAQATPPAPASAAPEPSPPALPVTDTPASAPSTETATSEAGSSRRADTGFLFRSEMSARNFAQAWPAIRDKITELGGKPAGTVELGWMRRADQSYFHFSLPESKFPELKAFIETFGPVRFTNERHPRVMPEGQIRIILTVKDGGSDEGQTETP